jgi:hypothetical protein
MDTVYFRHEMVGLPCLYLLYGRHRKEVPGFKYFLDVKRSFGTILEKAFSYDMNHF